MNGLIGSLFVLGSVITMVSANTAKKAFNKGCPLFFCFLCCLFADIVFLFSSGFKFDFNAKIITYSLMFALCFSLSNVCTTFALKFGSLSITGLVMSYSLIIPTFYGIIILGENTSVFFYIGLILLFVSAFLINFKPKSRTPIAEEKNGDKVEKVKKVKNVRQTVKWIVFIALAFIANGFCSVVQTAQQKAFNGNYKSEFMLIALTVASFSIFIISLFTEKRSIKAGGKKAIILGLICGISTGLLNLFVMFSVNYLPSSLIFPLISGGNLLLTFIVAKILFKEKFEPLRYVGFAFSIVAVVLLNL